MQRLLFVLPLAASLALGGCSVPAGIGAIAYVIDGTSLLGTGKTVSDHALSAAMDKDCALWRLATGELICQGPGEEGKPNAIAIAAAATVYPGEPEPALPEAQLLDPSSPVQLASLEPRAGGPASHRDTGERRWEPVLTIGDAAIRIGAHNWPIAGIEPVPLRLVEDKARDATGELGMIRAHQRLLEFRVPIEVMAHRPQYDG